MTLHDCTRSRAVAHSPARCAADRSAVTSSAEDTSVFLKTAPCNFALRRSALPRKAPVRSASLRSASLRSACSRLAPLRLAACRSARRRSAPNHELNDRFAWRRTAPVAVANAARAYRRLALVRSLLARSVAMSFAFSRLASISWASPIWVRERSASAALSLLACRRASPMPEKSYDSKVLPFLTRAPNAAT